MAVIETWLEQDLQAPVKVRYLDGNLFSNNGNGNRIGVRVYNNGEPVTLSGTVSGYVVVADGSTVPCTGSRSGNQASILIPPAAYQPGAVFISVFLTDGNTVTTLAAIATTVMQTRTNAQVSPGSVVEDWTQTINAAMQAVVDASAVQDAKISDLKSAIESDDNFDLSVLGIRNYPISIWVDGAINTTGTTIDITDIVSPTNPFKHLVIPCVAGDKFHVNCQGNSTYRPWAFVSSDKTKLSVSSQSIVDDDLTAPDNSAYLVCNVNFPDEHPHIVTKGTSRISTIETSLSTVTESYPDVKASALQLLKGDFERGAWRYDEPYVKISRAHQVRSSDYIVYDHDIELIAKDGFMFRFSTLDANNDFIFVGRWNRHYGVVPANTKFIITITSDPADTSSTADPEVNRTKVIVNEYTMSGIKWNGYYTNKIHLIGHRGWRGDETNYPENSVPAFEKAGQMGAWAIETDIRETSDNYFVIMHDETVDRTTDGTGKVAEMTFAQIEALNLIGGDGTLKVPTFQQYLEICKIYGCIAMIEVKGLQDDISSFARVSGIINDYGLTDYACFVVHTKEVYDIVRKHFKDCPIKFMTESETLWTDYGDYLNAMQCLGNMMCDLLTDDNQTRIARIKSVHNKNLVAGLISSSWSAQKTWLSNGIDMITSNNNLSIPSA